MSDVEQRLSQTFPQVNHDQSDPTTDEASETEKKTKKTYFIKEKIVMSPKRSKKKPSYIRQDTFNLDEETINPLAQTKIKKHNNLEPLRAKSSYGIKAILERAESISGLTPQVKEYLSSHMRMMGQENARLMIEMTNLRNEMNVINSNCDKQVKTVSQQLEKERAKNKMLMSQIRSGNNSNQSANDDIIILTSKNVPVSSSSIRERSASVGLGHQDRSSKKEMTRPSSVASLVSLGSVSLSRPGTPLPEGGENARIHLLNKKVKIYRSVLRIEDLYK